MSDLQRVLVLVQTAMDEFDSTGTTVAALVRRCQRIASLRGDAISLVWLDLAGVELDGVTATLCVVLPHAHGVTVETSGDEVDATSKVSAESVMHNVVYVPFLLRRVDVRPALISPDLLHEELSVQNLGFVVQANWGGREEFTAVHDSKQSVRICVMPDAIADLKFRQRNRSVLTRAKSSITVCDSRHDSTLSPSLGWSSIAGFERRTNHK